MTERRLHPRYTVQIPATVVCDDGLLRLPAEVVDQSPNGVRIRLADDERIRSDCYLLFGNRIEPFRVAWQASRSVGLEFLDRVENSPIADDGLPNECVMPQSDQRIDHAAIVLRPGLSAKRPQGGA